MEGIPGEATEEEEEVGEEEAEAAVEEESNMITMFKVKEVAQAAVIEVVVDLLPMALLLHSRAEVEIPAKCRI